MRIKLDHRDIEVRGVLALKGIVGVFKDRECLIEIAVEQSPQQQADTLIHELLHAIWATRNFPDRMGEEAVCTRLASALATVIRDNPALCAVLERALCSGQPIFE